MRMYLLYWFEIELFILIHNLFKKIIHKKSCVIYLSIFCILVRIRRTGVTTTVEFYRDREKSGVITNRRRES